MKTIRAAISLFILILIGVSIAGWVWTGAHQPAAEATASRIVLTAGIVAGLCGLGAVWRHSRGLRT